MDEKTLERYLKIRSLAERGERGEKETARKMMNQMEKKFPSIRAQADAFILAQGDAPVEETPGVWRKPPWSSASSPRSGNWENIFSYAWTVYDTARSFAETVADTYKGHELADEGVTSGTSHRDRVLYYRMLIPFDVIKKARELNPAQREAFRQVLHDRLNEFLDLLFE